MSSVSMYAEPDEFAGGKVLIGVGDDAQHVERAVLIVPDQGAELTPDECREVALGLLDALEVMGDA